MSPTQARILGYLQAHSPHWIGGYELRDAVCPAADVKGIHVQIHRMHDSRIESRRGPHGGYRILEAA